MLPYIYKAKSTCLHRTDINCQSAYFIYKSLSKASVHLFGHSLAPFFFFFFARKFGRAIFRSVGGGGGGGEGRVRSPFFGHSLAPFLIYFLNFIITQQIEGGGGGVRPPNPPPPPPCVRACYQISTSP